MAVALTVAELGADDVTIAVALLHGERTHSAEQLRSEFGADVSELLTDFLALKHAGSIDDMSGADPRAMVVRVAHRLHNMQTVAWLEKAKQQHKADQTRQLVAPLARALGLTHIAGELDVIATTILDDQAGPAIPEQPTITRGLLHAAARAVLPVRCRDRWLAEWDAELH